MADIILSQIGRYPVPARELQSRLANEYGSFCVRMFYRALRSLRGMQLIERTGTFRDAHNGGYQLARRR